MQCDKKSFQSIHEAKEFVKLIISKRSKKRLRIYKCDDCHKYHTSSDVGHRYEKLQNITLKKKNDDYFKELELSREEFD